MLVYSLRFTVYGLQIIEFTPVYIEGYIVARVFFISFSLLVIALSTAIPLYGFSRRRWKGAAIGCLLQPVVCVVVIGVVSAAVIAYKLISYEMEMKSAMVTVRSTEPGANGTDTLTWYLKPDEECFFDAGKKSDRFDIIPVDSLPTSVSVEDRLVVRFDINSEKVLATDYDQPAEVVSVDWDKVKAYVRQHCP